MKEDYEIDNRNKKKIPKVVQKYLMEVMSCHNGRLKN